MKAFINYELYFEPHKATIILLFPLDHLLHLRHILAHLMLLIFPFFMIQALEKNTLSPPGKNVKCYLISCLFSHNAAIRA